MDSAGRGCRRDQECPASRWRIRSWPCCDTRLARCRVRGKQEGEAEGFVAELCAHEALGDGGLGGEKSSSDFSGTESAEGAEGQGDLHLGGKLRVKAHEHQPQRVVGEWGRVLLAWAGRGGPALALEGNAVLLLVPVLLLREAAAGASTQA